MIIKNREELLSHGNIKARKIACDLIDFAMEAIDASGLTRKLVRRDRDVLKVGSLVYDLTAVGDIYVLGAGKAVLQIAEALDDILGDRIKAGVVVEKRLDGMTRGVDRIRRFRKIKVLEGAHPVPDEVAVQGAKEILDLARAAKEGDLVFFCVQGGCTCLTTMPADGLTLDDVQETTDLLLKSGWEIRAVNSVRTAITTLSWGRLAKFIHPAEIINLVVNDYVWNYPRDQQKDEYALGWGPSVPLPDGRRADFERNLSFFKEHEIWEKVPERVRNHIMNWDSGLLPQTVEDFERMGFNYHTFVLASPQDGAEAAKRGAERMGLNSMILSSMIEGEASEVGAVFAAIAKEIGKNRRPLEPPCVVIAAGEKTVTIVGEHGQGGRNQESVLSAALRIDGGDDIAILSIGTDGTDGPSYIAGGIVDGYSVRRAKEKGMNPVDHLNKHNSSYVLTELGDAILFDEPGNNVCDLSLIVVTDR